MFNILTRIVNAAKGGILASLQGVGDIFGATVMAAKNLTVDTFRESGKFIKGGIAIPAAIIKGTLEGVTMIGISIVKAIRGIVEGTIQGAMESGMKQEEAVQSTVSQALYSAKEFGEDVAATAVEAVLGVVHGVTKAGGDVASATGTAVKTALEVAEEIGDETFTAVKNSLETSVKGAKEFISEVEGKKADPTLRPDNIFSQNKEAID